METPELDLPNLWLAPPDEATACDQVPRSNNLQQQPSFALLHGLDFELLLSSLELGQKQVNYATCQTALARWAVSASGWAVPGRPGPQTLHFYQ